MEVGNELETDDDRDGEDVDRVERVRLTRDNDGAGNSQHSSDVGAVQST